MNRAIHKMLANNIPLSVYLIKILIFFNGHRHINCEVTAVATDICVIKGRSTDPYYFDPRNVTRAVSPSCAGQEGISIYTDNRDDFPAVFKIDDAALFDSPVNPFERPLMKSNMYFSIQFFMKLAPVKERTQLFSYRNLDIRQAMNNSISIEYGLTNTSDTAQVNKKLWFETPKNDTELCNLANGVQSDWIQLIGMKVKVSERKKRATPSGGQTKNYPWMKVGIEYDRHPKSGHLSFYINGKVVHSITTNKDQFVYLESWSRAEICIANAQFSCIEYSNDRQDASYFADPSLKECMAFYKGKPEKDFVDCEK